jgi:protein PhnA
MSDLPKCKKCESPYTYEDRGLFVCPECGYEWSADDVESENSLTVKDSNGNILNDGDSVTVIKDLKIKGASSVIKVGTKIKNIRLVESSDEHNIECKVSGVGSIKVRQKFVKKS